MQPELLKDLSQHRQRLVERRELLKSVTAVAGIHAFSHFFLESSAFAAATNSEQDAQAAGVGVETVHYPSDNFSIEAYVAKPKAGGSSPAIIVIHDNRGLNDYVRNVTRRFAAAGFIAMAPDLLSRVGGTAKSSMPGAATRALRSLPAEVGVDDLKSGFAFLAKYPGVDAAKISAVGFGWGGWRSFTLAADVPQLYRAVIFCGSTPTEGLQNIHARVLAHYAQYDFQITGDAIFTENTMKQLGKSFTYYAYPKVYHSFFNESEASQYDADAAKLAWSRTVEFLRSSA